MINGTASEFAAIGSSSTPLSDASVHVNALTVDVEDYFHVSALSKHLGRDSWNRLEYRVVASTETLLHLFDEAGIKATFFVLGWVAERSPELVRRIHREGHEIACHGLTHELVYRQSPEVFEEETHASKCLLEDATGSIVHGYRAASWSITRQSLWALDTLCKLGFSYDSSIFPIRHDRYGIPNAPRWPGRITAPGGQSIAEFPPSTVSILGTRIPVSGGGYFRLLPYWLTRGALDRINRRDERAFMFYLHPWEIDPDQPRIKASPLSSFRHYTNLDKTERRLRKLVGEFSFSTAHSVLLRLGVLEA
jgi:polysaccharide deacetylase family protein (PEP-CTERM system associated)